MITEDDYFEMILRSDVQAFNTYRQNNPHAYINLAGEVIGPGLNLDGIDLSEADLRNTKFIDCTLIGAMFCGAQMPNARFIECFMERASLRSAYAPNIVFVDCDVSHAYLVDIRKAQEEAKMVFIFTDTTSCVTDQNLANALQVGKAPAVEGSIRTH